jgi:hypothetical protein
VRHHRFSLVLVLAVALVVIAGQAPAALALGASVRVEASSQTVAPDTSVKVASAPTFSDSAGNPYVTSKPNALAALAAAAYLRGFTWEASFAGSFVNNVAGFTSLPDWSQGWVYTVNGVGYPIVDVSAIDFALLAGDRTLWAQSPDATFARGSSALVVRTDNTARTTGESLTVTVVADNLGKVNSQADYDRYSLTDPSLLETPAQFAAVADATVHVGSATYTSGADGTVTVAAPDAGTSRVWAEKAMDASTWYVRSEQTLVNFAPALELSGTSVTPLMFRPGMQKPKLVFTLSRAAAVVIQVRDSHNKTIFSRTLQRGSGAGSYTWSGRAKTGRYVARHATYTMRVRAVDTWGRVTAWNTFDLTTK